MKKILPFVLILILFVVPIATPHVSFAQTDQCTDGKDNDGDKKIDKTGATVMVGAQPQVFPADPECVQGFVCEDGKTACLSSNPITPGTTQDPNTIAPNGAPSAGQGTDFPLQVRLQNPLKVDNIQDAISLFMDAVVKVAIPFIIVFFIWSGINFILAQGNADKLKKARMMFWYTVIGTLLILGAWAITDAIVGTINSIAS